MRSQRRTFIGRFPCELQQNKSPSLTRNGISIGNGCEKKYFENNISFYLKLAIFWFALVLFYE